MIHECPLCDVITREPQNVLFESYKYAIVRTKNLKGHRERVMILWVDHDSEPFYDVPQSIYSELRTIFRYAYKIVVMSGKYGSVPNHYHLCVTDLNPNSDDFEQILGTPWIKVIDIQPWKV